MEALLGNTTKSVVPQAVSLFRVACQISNLFFEISDRLKQTVTFIVQALILCGELLKVSR